VIGEQALADFRQGLTGCRTLDLLAEAGGQLVVRLPVGVGKSEWLVRTVEHVVTTGTYDLIVLLLPRWDVARELLDRLPTAIPKIVLRPRPASRCGDRDAAWTDYEQNGLSLLGRRELCKTCPADRAATGKTNIAIAFEAPNSSSQLNTMSF
jgi:hypothetical protein